MKKGKTIASVFALGWCAASFFLALLFVQVADLKPQIDINFFFSSDDPQFRDDKQISLLFPQPPQIVISAIGEIESPAYLEKIRQLTDKLREIPEVFMIHSLTRGPASAEDANKSPLWQRILVTSGRNASNLHVFVRDVPTDQIIPKVEAAMQPFESPDFQLKISGVPYVVEQVRRNLLHDFKIFSLAAFAIFSVMILIMFRSARIWIGAMVTCFDTSMLSLLAAQVMHVKLGLLTANLSTIVFVLALSHIIFLTFNWKEKLRTEPEGKSDHILDAIRMTLPGSFWSMVTVLLSFISLLFVEAKPLRQLGMTGSVGTVIAFAAAYLIFPCFLKSRGRKKFGAGAKKPAPKMGGYWGRRHTGVVMIMVLLTLLCVPGLPSLNMEPSLLSYFKEGSRLRNDLEFIDHNIGSSPLKIVVRDHDQAKFNTDETLKRLWALHLDLEKNPSVGSVVSLPLIMAEAKRSPLAMLLRWEWLIKILESPKYEEIAQFFITKDRQHTLFLITMKEERRNASRRQIIEDVRSTIMLRGLEPIWIGGIYLLQTKISTLVQESMISGILLLLLIFTGIGLLLSRSIGSAMALFSSLLIIPICTLGSISYLRIPVDVISSPAVNIALGMGVDAMIHSLIWLRRFRKKGNLTWRAIVETRLQLWKPIVFATIIIALGFGIFGLSNFPPTRRFGLSAIIGSLIAPFAALFVLPYLLGRRLPEQKESQHALP